MIALMIELPIGLFSLLIATEGGSIILSLTITVPFGKFKRIYLSQLASRI